MGAGEGDAVLGVGFCGGGGGGGGGWGGGGGVWWGGGGGGGGRLMCGLSFLVLVGEDEVWGSCLFGVFCMFIGGGCEVGRNV